MVIVIILLACAGFAVSLYGFMVEMRIKKNPAYKPFCDISDRISCSKPITSSYGSVMRVPNTILGMVYYGAIILLTLFGYAYLVRLLTVAGTVATVGFAYILFAKIRSFCLICLSTYAINIALLLIALQCN